MTEVWERPQYEFEVVEQLETRLYSTPQSLEHEVIKDALDKYERYGTNPCAFFNEILENGLPPDLSVTSSRSNILKLYEQFKDEIWEHIRNEAERTAPLTGTNKVIDYLLSILPVYFEDIKDEYTLKRLLLWATYTSFVNKLYHEVCLRERE